MEWNKVERAIKSETELFCYCNWYYWNTFLADLNAYKIVRWTHRKQRFYHYYPSGIPLSLDSRPSLDHFGVLFLCSEVEFGEEAVRYLFGWCTVNEGRDINHRTFLSLGFLPWSLLTAYLPSPRVSSPRCWDGEIIGHEWQGDKTNMTHEMWICLKGWLFALLWFGSRGWKAPLHHRLQ